MREDSMDIPAIHRSGTASAGAILLSVLLVATALPAAESDLSITVTAIEEAHLGQVIPFTIGYGNAGPETAGSAYINVYLPSGVPAPLDQLTQEQRDAIEESLRDTDTLGNEPLLFDEETFCEGLLIQLQRRDDDDDPNPVEGLDPGVSASFGFEAAIPMEPPRFGRVTITEPGSLAQTWGPAVTGADRLEAADRNLYGRGYCEKDVGGPDESTCAFITDNCFGERISLMDPVEAEFELVDDGSDNPTWGCEGLEDFTPGNIAVIRRGSCEFDVKVFNAKIAGAIAAVIVNHEGCGWDHPDSDQCVIDTYGWSQTGFQLPNVMLAKADGEPIITALEAGTTVRGIIGPQEDALSVDGFAFLADEADHDPNPDNNQGQIEIVITPEVLVPPYASYTYSPVPPIAGNPVHFTERSTQGPATSWFWDFGDGGGTSTERDPSYTYAASGVYTVVLTATNSAGSDDFSRHISVIGSGSSRQGGGRHRPDAP
jgi:hypothetical protein